MSLEPKNASTPSLVPRLFGRRSISRIETIPSPIHFNQSMDVTTNREEDKSKKYDDANETSSDKSDDGSISEDRASITEDSSDNEDVKSERNTGKLPNYEGMKNIIKPDPLKKIEKEALAKGLVLESARYGTLESPQIPRTTSNNTFNSQIFVIASICIIGVIVALVNGLNTNVPPIITIDTLKKTFPQQDDSFWPFIKSGVSEIENFDKPSVIILMYKDEKVSYTNKLISSITEYASCILNKDCSVEPISLVGKELNTEEITKDYGVIIDKYRLLLEQKHIMVVQNMEEILGTVAQAFHSFCDEYTPVDEYYGKPLQQVGDILENKWGDIDRDKLEALITRVSSVVLRIK